MDYTKQHSLIAHPAHLWIGTSVNEQIKHVLKKILCGEHAVSCVNCLTLHEQQQHPLLLWIKPEKMYTLADIEPLFEIIKFSLDPNRHFFFVLEKADYLSSAVANRLLKIIEEPPAGYHIVLLAQRQEQVITTIRSRCIIQLFDKKQDMVFTQTLVKFFTQIPMPEPLLFLQTLEKTEINETETFEQIDQLFAYWQTAPEENRFKKSMIALLAQALEKPPMPGSTKLFWKNLYLQASSIKSILF